LNVAQKKVGMLAGGWAAAAAEFNVSLPMWIKRHGGGASVPVVKKSSSGYVVIIKNSMPYGDLQRHANRALLGRNRKLEARLPMVLKGALRRARMESMAVV
jgi:hypothetical protein